MAENPVPQPRELSSASSSPKSTRASQYEKQNTENPRGLAALEPVSFYKWAQEGLNGLWREAVDFWSATFSQHLTKSQLIGRVLVVVLYLVFWTIMGVIIDETVENDPWVYHAEEMLLSAVRALPLVLLMLFWPRNSIKRTMLDSRSFFTFSFIIWLFHTILLTEFIFNSVETTKLAEAYNFQKAVKETFKSDASADSPLFVNPDEWWDFIGETMLSPLIPPDDLGVGYNDPSYFHGYAQTSHPLLVRGAGGYLELRQQRGTEYQCKFGYNPNINDGQNYPGVPAPSRCFTAMWDLDHPPADDFQYVMDWPVYNNETDSFFPYPINLTASWWNGDASIRFGRKAKMDSVRSFSGSYKYEPGGYIHSFSFTDESRQAILNSSVMRRYVMGQLDGLRRGSFVNLRTRFIEAVTYVYSPSTFVWVLNAHIHLDFAFASLLLLIISLQLESSWCYIRSRTEFLISGGIRVQPTLFSFGEIGEILYPPEGQKTKDGHVPSRSFFDGYYIFEVLLTLWESRGAIDAFALFILLKCGLLLAALGNRLRADFHFPSLCCETGNVSFNVSADMWVLSRDCLAIAGLLLWVSLLRYLGAWQGADLVPATMRHGAVNFFYFLVSFVIILWGFILCFWVMYASDVEGFSKPSLSIQTLWDALLGNLESDDFISEERFIIGIMMYILFSFLMLFCVLVIIIVIVEDAFAKSKEDVEVNKIVTVAQSNVSASLDLLGKQGVASDLSRRSLIMVMVSQNQQNKHQLEEIQAGAQTAFDAILNTLQTIDSRLQKLEKRSDDSRELRENQSLTEDACMENFTVNKSIAGGSAASESDSAGQESVV